ncbi:Eco57I restriction-modification methylase domain-containing protein [Glycomyces tritici]|uniref:site-specific DNA-methyltransferase (adenine-specific) n=1 Tax=Glycomyces tritici TaxID=2665176 RepID=A0ABT7YXQ3_9ACTN|nr:DNA methyltransferase [Glycomyces tritici]MDN3243426.1 hypothetical protein [Glycomyces tritici]
MKHLKPIKPEDLHRAWLDLVETDGPFLSLPVLKRVWPAGMAALEPEPRAVLRAALPAFEKAWDELDRVRDETALDRYREARDTWVETVLRDVFGWGASYVTGDAPALAGISVQAPNRSVTVTPSGALVRGEKIGALTLVCENAASLHDALADGWNSSPIDRMSELLRASGVPVGVVTDGRWWAIVSAQPELSTASGVTDAHLWIEEPGALFAFAQLLSRKHLIGGKESDRLGKLFVDSVADAADITDALGVQVRRAVELLVQSFSESALRAAANGEPDPLPENRDEVYQAAVTVMMRVVFLLFAEERGLLPENELFAAGYGLADRYDLLDQRSRDEGIGALGGTYISWYRLLAASRALYEGAIFDGKALPAYGGSLFDPDRTRFLTEAGADGLAVKVSDRVMLEVLRAVQVPEIKGEALRISFREIDVEQIGYIYEGLLGYSAADVEEVMVGLIGKAGAEPEIPLSVLEGLAAKHLDVGKLAAAIIKWSKEHQKAAEPPSASALAKAFQTGAEDVETAIRAVTMDPELQERLRPFIGIIRRDLRGWPLAVMPGGVMVVETPSRANAGAHYTPKDLAEEVVTHALEPLVYKPGPHQTDDRKQWVLLHPDEILELKVADIACGSGAFLVAAARYLAGKLVEAWQENGMAYGSGREVETRAIRMVVARCLYGADINELAVEMCKLSLWLVSLDPDLPFSFVDDKIFCGNSLLGIIDRRQIESFNINPETAAPTTLFDLDAGTNLVQRIDIRDTLNKVIALRRNLASEVDNTDPQRSVAAKRQQVERQQELTQKATDIADGVIAAGLRLGGKPGKKLKEAYEDLRVAIGLAYPNKGEPNREMLDGILKAGLTPTVRTDYERWKPLHWVLAAPDVIVDHGGFDAVVGNPPFLGGKKVTGATGTNIRDWFVNRLAGAQKGNADLVAYFFLRAKELLTPTGNLGLIATNTIAQGDTREVGLDRLEAGGFTITQSIQSQPWPVKTANLEYAAVWGSFGPVSDDVNRIADGENAKWIITMLDPARGPERMPARLAENTNTAFIGLNVNCVDEFSMTPSHANEILADNPNLKSVIKPYLDGENLNQTPGSKATRRIVDFTGKSESEIAAFGAAYDWVNDRVKPARARLTNKPKLQKYWWLYEREAISLRKAVKNLDEVLAIALVSKTVMPLRVPTGQVFSHMLGVFATDSYSDQAVLSSSLHQLWAIKYASSMRTDVRYTPSDVFLPFPLPPHSEALDEVGRILDTERREIMLRRDLGLTKLYNLVNDPTATTDPDITRLREIHVELDLAVLAAYGWDIPPDHGFHEYRRMTRFTLSREARVEVFDRLLKENHRRAALQGEAPEVEAEEDDE